MTCSTESTMTSSNLSRNSRDSAQWWATEEASPPISRFLSACVSCAPAIPMTTWTTDHAWGETFFQYFMHFTKDMCRLYGEKYLNRPLTREELQLVLDGYKDAVFPGCVGCLDFMKLVGKNFPLAEK